MGAGSYASVSSPALSPLGVSLDARTPAGRGAGGKGGLWNPGGAPGAGASPPLSVRCPWEAGYISSPFSPLLHT